MLQSTSENLLALVSRGLVKEAPPEVHRGPRRAPVQATRGVVPRLPVAIENVNVS